MFLSACASTSPTTSLVPSHLCFIFQGGLPSQLGSVAFEQTPSKHSPLVSGMQNNGVVDANMAMAAIEAGFDERWVF